MKIVILDGAGANPGDISWEPLERFGEVTAYDYTSKEQVVERASGAEICITNKTVFDADTSKSFLTSNTSASLPPATT